MPQIRNPRRGSMQYWPRKRAKKPVSRIRHWGGSAESKLLGFAAYKVGMTHIVVTDNEPNSPTKDTDVVLPVTVLEAPPLKIAAILLYKHNIYGMRPSGQITAEKLDKELSRIISLPKKHKQADMTNLADVRVLAYTRPHLTGFGKKRPELLELGIGGKLENKLAYAQSILGKEISATDVFNQGQFVDTVAVTKGKGKQGPVKRFGVMIRHHKSEKTKRGPGTLGPWHGARIYRVALAGQMGYQQRTERNKRILKIGNNGKEITPSGGWLRYGNTTAPYILIKGSVQGASKRLVTLVAPRRRTPKIQKEPPIIVQMSTSSHQ